MISVKRIKSSYFSSINLPALNFYMMALSLFFFMLAQQVHAFETPTVAGKTKTDTTAQQESTNNLELLFDRRASLRRLGDPKYFDLDVNYVRAHDVLAATALLGCGKEEWKNFLVDLPSKGTANKPTEMFSLVPMVRYLYQYGHCLTDMQKSRLLVNLNKPQIILGHGTTNMAIVQASSWYLLAQYFPVATWFDLETHKSYTSAQIMTTLKPLLASRTRRIFHSGHYEWLSPNYALLNIYPLLNLIDFADDNEIKNNANDEAILEVAMLRAHSFHGVIVPPLTRKSFDQRNALDTPPSYAPSISQQAIWYYFGEPSGLGLHDFRSGLGSFFVSMLGVSAWLPPSIVLDMEPTLADSKNQSVTAVTPRFTTWENPTEPEIFGDSLITDDFSIGTGNVLFDPLGYSGHIQTFSILLKSTKPHNEIECYQPYWHSTAGEDAWDTDRSSPFQQMYRYDDSSVVMLFDIPKSDPWKSDASNRFWADRSTHMDNLLQLVTCRFARDFDEIIPEQNWVFVRHGKVFVAMATLKGSNEYDNAGGGLLQHFKMVKIHEPKTALFFRVDKQRSDLNFTQFRQSIRNNLPSYDPLASSIVLKEKNGSKTQVYFELKKQAKGTYWSALPRIIRDGKPIAYDSSYAMKSPEMTLRDGVLIINTSVGELTLSH